MGLLSLGAKAYDHAVDWFSRAIRRDPKPLYLTNLGTALLAQSRFEDALRVFEKALQLKSDDAELWSNLGRALVEAGALQTRSRPSSKRSGSIRGIGMRHARARFCSSTFNVTRRRSVISSCVRNYGLIRPRCVRRTRLPCRTWQFPGMACEDSKRPWSSADKRTHLTPLTRTYATLSPLAFNLCAVTKNPCRGSTRPPNCNQTILGRCIKKARALRQLRRFNEAVAILFRMGLLMPDCDAIERHIEHIHLLTGNFEAGWAKREVQWKAAVLPSYYPNFSGPIWLGEEPIEGKTLLIYADEGLGDTIHFARYVLMVAARGARVILVVDAPLHSLLSALPGVSLCLLKSSPKDTCPAFDVHCPICALPLAFPRSLDAIPSKTPYLPLPEQSRMQAREDRLGSHSKLRVGLAWSGNPGHDNDHNRSIPLRMFADLLGVDASFVSLKKDPNPGDKPALQESGIVDLTAYLTDFVETAALVSCLDLVITIDTSVAHLAGALARPTWILLPYTPDYRWLLDRDDSPWYPTARLFRQSETREYANMIECVRDELLARVSVFEAEK
jgi:hypothetical protein